MSKQEIADILCNSCGETFEVLIYASINSDHNPELRERILNGTFFTYSCTNCGNVITAFHEVLYHDMTKNFMVWLAKPDKQNIIFFQKNSLKLASVIDDYKFYIARYPFQFAERIITSELNLDPRIIELYKFSLKVKDKMPLNSENDFFHFNNLGRNIFLQKKFYWKMIYDNGEVEELSKTVNSSKFRQYENLINSIEPKLKERCWYLIDWQFPFGLEIQDGELITLPTHSDFIEIGENKLKLPNQFLDVLERTGKGHEI